MKRSPSPSNHSTTAARVTCLRLSSASHPSTEWSKQAAARALHVCLPRSLTHAHCTRAHCTNNAPFTNLVPVVACHCQKTPLPYFEVSALRPARRYDAPARVRLYFVIRINVDSKPTKCHDPGSRHVHGIQRRVESLHPGLRALPFGHGPQAHTEHRGEDTQRQNVLHLGHTVICENPVRWRSEKHVATGYWAGSYIAHVRAHRLDGMTCSQVSNKAKRRIQHATRVHDAKRF